MPTTETRLRLALLRAADVMQRSSPGYCATNDVERVTDQEWDDALRAVEDALDAIINETDK